MRFQQKNRCNCDIYEKLPHLQLGWNKCTVHRRLRGLFVYQEKSLAKLLQNFEVRIRSLGNKLHTSRNIYSGFYTTMNYRSKERSGYWQVDTYCYVYILMSYYYKSFLSYTSFGSVDLD